MILITQELKNTLKNHPHIDTVYFNSVGDYFFQAHPHIVDGKTAMYSRYRKENIRKSTDKEDAPTKIKITTKEEDLITDTLSASDIISRPVDKDLTSDQARIVADENASLRKELEDLKAKQAENEALKKEIEALKAGSVESEKPEDKRPIEKIKK